MIRRTACLLLIAPLLLAGCTLTGVLDQLTNSPPVAIIAATSQQGIAPFTVQFDAGHSHDDGMLVSYRWEFGDPHDTEIAFGKTASHTYSLSGTYIVKLTVTDDQGEVDVQRLPIVVDNPPPAAEFSISHDLPPVGATVVFDATGSVDPDGGSLSFFWDFGDGTTATGPVASHSYTQPLYYVVELTVSDDDGVECTERRPVIVQDGSGGDDTCVTGSCGGSAGGGDRPLAVVSGIPGCQGCYVNAPLTLDGSYSRAAESENRIVQYHWDFGDGTTATGPVVEHTYTRTYRRVTLVFTVTDDNGQRTSAVYTFPVVNPPSF